MKLRIGLIGLGTSWETRYRPALRSLANRFDVRAICDPIAHRAELAAEEFGATALDGFHALASRDDIDGVLLLSAQWYGSLPILACCDTEKAVYCADTLNLEIDQAASIKKRVEAAGIAFIAELPNRLSPATLRLKELIATRLGPAKLLFCHRRKPILTDTDHPNGGAERDLIELVDWCRYVVGTNPTSVIGVAHAKAPGSNGDDYRMLSLDFSKEGPPGTGAVAQISCGRYLPSDSPEAISFRPPAQLQVSCDKGVVFVDQPTTLIWFDDAGRHMESLENERPVGEQLLLGFYRAATSLVRDTSSFEDAYRALDIVLQAKASHENGRRKELTS